MFSYRQNLFRLNCSSNKLSKNTKTVTKQYLVIVLDVLKSTNIDINLKLILQRKFKTQEKISKNYRSINFQLITTWFNQRNYEDFKLN